MGGMTTECGLDCPDPEPEPDPEPLDTGGSEVVKEESCAPPTLARFLRAAFHFLPTEPMRDAREDLAAFGGVTGATAGGG